MRVGVGICHQEFGWGGAAKSDCRCHWRQEVRKSANCQLAGQAVCIRSPYATSSTADATQAAGAATVGRGTNYERSGGRPTTCTSYRGVPQVPAYGRARFKNLCRLGALRDETACRPAAELKHIHEVLRARF